MDKQRNETVRLDHESKSSLPTTLSKWFIEDDATTLYTRTIFYKIQEEILASCLEMQIKRMSEEVDGVTHFEIRDVRVKDKLFKVFVSMDHAVCSCKKFVMCGIVCRHAFCGLKQIGVTKFPRSLVLNRWMQTADSGTLSNLDVVTSDYFKMEQVSLKLAIIWFDFCQAVDKAGVEMDRLEHVHNTIKKLNTELDAYDGSIVGFTKKDHIAAMVGQQPEGEVNILPPNICKNKGNYFKWLMSDREKAINKSKKRSRKCALCRATTHDATRCIKRKKASVE
ncbi:protein FAR1-RELATED SEQUENCE 7-like [Apium graveolens]|uniref:protein FAR1-RELATED SEQUENCE 7-like n=1 Tax=Apium graveolens TaxID=4045 RepID=UPI003D7BBB19